MFLWTIIFFYNQLCFQQSFLDLKILDTHFDYQTSEYLYLSPVETKEKLLVGTWVWPSSAYLVSVFNEVQQMLSGQMLPGQMLPGQMSLWQMSIVKEEQGKLPLKFSQNRMSNSWDIAYILLHFKQRDAS